MPSKARCLFLPANISIVNDCLERQAESKDHPVWISRPEGDMKLKGMLYDKVSKLFAAVMEH